MRSTSWKKLLIEGRVVSASCNREVTRTYHRRVCEEDEGGQLLQEPVSDSFDRSHSSGPTQQGMKMCYIAKSMARRPGE